MFYIAGPGHGGPALVGHAYLEGRQRPNRTSPKETAIRTGRRRGPGRCRRGRRRWIG
jgi:hypothetical protein